MIDQQVPLIQAREVSRSFGAVRALDAVSADFYAGEVHGLVGANGAGKSTLLNILAGAVTPTSGQIIVDGVATAISQPKEAEKLGFAFIHQELALVPDFSAADNITLGLRAGTRAGFTNAKQLGEIARGVAARLRLRFDLRRPVRTLSAAERGMVAIARALARDARFIAMDEPTAALSSVECDRLFEIIRTLAAEGVSIAYVSHRLDEIVDLSDRVTVFKDGQVTGRYLRDEYSRINLIEGITGGTGTIATRVPPSVSAGSPTAIEVKNLSDGDRVRDVTFDCKAGEIVGLAGVVGAGRSEILHLLFGDSQLASGTVTLGDANYRPTSPSDAIRRRIALVPEERRSQALMMDETIRSNITLGNWRAMRSLPPFGMISDRKSERVASDMMRRLSIKAGNSRVQVRKLSGGNQQKVVFARWIARDPKVLLLDEPTRGVDVGARQQIWETVEDLAASGCSVVLVSSELDELSICHRVFVVVEGRTLAELDGPGVTEDQLLAVIYGAANDIEDKEAR